MIVSSIVQGTNLCFFYPRKGKGNVHRIVKVQDVFASKTGKLYVRGRDATTIDNGFRSFEVTKIKDLHVIT